MWFFFRMKINFNFATRVADVVFLWKIKVNFDFATRASPAFWRGTFDNHLKSTQKRFFKQAAGNGVFCPGPRRQTGILPQIWDCGCQRMRLDRK